MKNFLVTLVLALAVAGMAMPQTVGVGVGPTFGEAVSAAETLYRKAVLRYSFNDPSNPGKASAQGEDLDDIGVPMKMTGGGHGWSMKVDGPTFQGGSVTDNAELSQGTNKDFGVCTWVQTDTVVDATTSYIISKGGIWGYTLLENSSETFQFSVRGAPPESVLTTAMWSGTIIDEERYFVCGIYDESTGLAGISVNGATAEWDAGGPILNNPVDDTYDFFVGALGPTSGGFDGSIGPVVYYKFREPPYVSLWNSGKGQTCAKILERSNLKACWDLNESGGTYVDSVSTNDLTAFNSPVRDAAIVEQPGSGMGLWLEGGQLAQEDAPSALLASHETTGAVTVSFWGMKNADPWGEFFQVYNTSNYIQYRITGGGAVRYIVNIWDSTNTMTCQALQGHGTEEYDIWVLYTFRLEYPTTCSLSIDNGRIAITDPSFPRAGAPASPVYRFRIGPGWGGCCEAKMDNLAIFDYILSADEEATLWNAGAGYYFAQFFDTIFHGPRFAWSQKPTLRRF
jgi:hypothetical protein